MLEKESTGDKVKRKKVKKALGELIL